MSWYSTQNKLPEPKQVTTLLNLPPYAVNTQHVSEANIKSNNDYRKYLTKNADNIVSVNQKIACGECCNCPPIYGNKLESNFNKHIFTSVTDSSSPYHNTDLKADYLAKRQNMIKKGS
tara:strand:- start:53 stop:406 length:354 start_codon:yes stop_codon:yes gene_type:complete